MKRLKPAILAAGLGGTHLTAALVAEPDRIAWSRTVSAPCGGELMEKARRAPDRVAFTLEHWDAFIPHRERLLDAAAALLVEARERAASMGLAADRAGVGVAGAVNPLTGVVEGKTGALNHPAWGEFHPGRALEERTGLAVTCLNDAKAMALGALATLDSAAVAYIAEKDGFVEVSYPLSPAARAAGLKGAPDFIEIDPGTGLGGAYIVNGKVWYGPDPEKPDPDVGEIWKLEVDPERPQVRFEEMASGRAVADRVVDRAAALGGREFAEFCDRRSRRIQDILAARCPPLLEKIITEELFDAGRSIAMGILHLSGPERERLGAPPIRTFVIGGGLVSGRRPESILVRRTIQGGILSFLEKNGTEPLPDILFTTLGGRALLIGAARAAGSKVK